MLREMPHVIQICGTGVACTHRGAEALFLEQVKEGEDEEEEAVEVGCARVASQPLTARISGCPSCHRAISDRL